MKFLDLVEKTECRICEDKTDLAWYLQLGSRRIPFIDNQFIWEAPYDKSIVLSLGDKVSDSHLNRKAGFCCICRRNYTPHYGLSTQYIDSSIPIGKAQVDIVEEFISTEDYYVIIQNLLNIITIHRNGQPDNVFEFQTSKSKISKEKIDKILLLL